MKKTIFVSLLLAAMSSTIIWALDEKEVQTKMKAAGDAMGGLRKSLGAGSMPDVAKHAKSMTASLDGGVDKFWASMGMAKAAEWQKSSVAASKALEAAAESGNADAVKAAMGKLGSTCKQCHEAHREKVSENVYKIKK